jgi:hypothetical protein
VKFEFAVANDDAARIGAPAEQPTPQPHVRSPRKRGGELTTTRQ